MKKKTLFCLTSFGLCLGALSACSGGSDYYEVKFYTDYEGISSGAPGSDYSEGLDVSRAIYVGSAYVAKNASSRVARLSHLAKDDSGKAISYQETRQKKQEGYLYSFDGWQGFYDAGALFASNAPADLKIDLKNIQADCAVFAHFSAEKEKFSVTIKDADSSPLFEGAVEYGERLGEALAEKYGNEAAAENAFSNLTYPLSSPYYEEHAFSGQFEDSEGTRYNVSSLFDLQIKKKQTFKPIYKNGVFKTYTVRFFSDASLGTPIEVNGGNSANVVYGSSISSSEYSLPGDETSEFLKWAGNYDEGAPEAIKGTPVDPNHILFDCSLYPVFGGKKQSVNVTFYNADGTINKQVDVEKGCAFASLSAPKTISGVPAGQVFSSYWSKDSMGIGEFAKGEDALSESTSYYPVCVAAAFENVSGAKGDKFTYEYDLSKRGYVLSSFTPSPSRSDKVLAEDDLNLSVLPSRFSLIGIEKLSSADDSYRSALESASFPSSVKYVASKAFAYHSFLRSISLPGLEEIEAFGFSDLYSLGSIELPASLKKAGSKAFYADAKLTSIRLRMSEKEAESRDFASDWNSNGETLIPLSFDAAE